MVSRAALLTWTALTVVATWGCKPEEEGRPSQLLSPRVLAVQALPAEVKPEQTTTLEILRAGPAGRLDATGVTLDFCVTRKPIAAPGIVAEACLELQPNDSLAPIEISDPIVATIPKDACSLFGPKPATNSNKEALRPADPDTTGGYYQPIRLVDDQQIALFAARVSCGLTGTTQETSIEYNRRYRANDNPAIEKLLLGRGNGDVETLSTDTPVLLQPGEAVALAVVWDKCPINRDECGDAVCALDETAADCPDDCTQTTACSGAETYLLMDPVSRQLRLERENVRVSWFVTGGALELDKSGRGSDEQAHDAQNQYNAPTKVGDYWLFAVIRDDRGGVGWLEQPIRVE